MIDLTQEQLNEVSGGFHIGRLGTIVFGLAAGFIAGGPVGLGMAAGALIGAEGVDDHRPAGRDHP